MKKRMFETGPKGVIEFITNTIRISKKEEQDIQEQRNGSVKKTHTHKRKITYPNFGKLTTKDWDKINIGMDILIKITRAGFDMQKAELLKGENDIGKVQKNLYQYSSILQECIYRLDKFVNIESNIQEAIEELGGEQEILQAARDGVLIEKRTRVEEIDGEKKEIEFDSQLTPEEIMSFLIQFSHSKMDDTRSQINTYLTIGLATSGLIGTIFGNNSKKEKNSAETLLIFSQVSCEVLNMFMHYGYSPKQLLEIAKSKFKNIPERENNHREVYKLKDEIQGMTNDLLDNEQINDNVKDEAMEDIIQMYKRESSLYYKIDNKEFLFNIINEVIQLIFSAIYFRSQLEFNEKGMIKGPSMAKALINLQQENFRVKVFTNFPKQIMEFRANRQTRQYDVKRLEGILKQMEEKVYPLKCVEHSFDSLKIENFNGIFHQITVDYGTGEQSSVKIDIPEFSMKRGDVILLSGKSGEGKTTFLNFLKRGDINNRSAIQIDGKETVDKIGGKECSSFNRKMDLGERTTVLFQVTGKNGVSELTEKEKENLLILRK